MPLATGFKLVGLFLGAGALGIALILQARVLAFLQDGTFRALGPLVLGTLGSLLVGTVAGVLFVRAESPAKRAHPPHPSLLSEVATEAAQGAAPRDQSWAMSLTAPLLAAVPLGVLLFAARSEGGELRASSAFHAAATSTVALLFFAAGAPGGRASPRSSRAALQSCVIALLGLAGGVLTASRATSEFIGFKDLATIVVLLAGAVALIGVLSSRLDRWQRPLAVAILVLAVGRGATYVYASFDGIYERLTDLEDTQSDERFARVFESRYGALTLTTSGWLHENGRVQGIFNTNPVPAADLNRCARAYVIPSVVPDLKEVLFLGLENASFAQVLGHYPTVERVIILEENRAYERAAGNSGMVASLLRNERVKVVYGDLSSTVKAQGKFDVIISDRLPFRNDGASRYLTQEFLSELASHLTPQGALYLNTLGKVAIERTLVETFPHLLRYQDMIFASEERLEVDGYKWMRDLMAWKIDGQLVLHTKSDPTEIARQIVKNRDFRGSFAWEREEQIKQRTKGEKPQSAASLESGLFHFDTLP